MVDKTQKEFQKPHLSILLATLPLQFSKVANNPPPQLVTKEYAMYETSMQRAGKKQSPGDVL